MTTAHLSTTTIDTRATAPIGVATAVVAGAATAYGAHTWTEVLVCLPLIALTAAVVFGVVAPRALRKESAGGTALALAIPAALLLLPAFWAGIPFVLAVAALLVGRAARSGTSIAGLVLGALVAVGYIATYVSEIVAGAGGFEYL